MEITEGLTSFPKILTLEKQGMFALGFYHQKADDRAAAKAKSAENAAQKDDDVQHETESE
jgi:CRISPR-associated protein Csd1